MARGTKTGRIYPRDGRLVVSFKDFAGKWHQHHTALLPGQEAAAERLRAEIREGRPTPAAPGPQGRLPYAPTLDAGSTAASTSRRGGMTWPALSSTSCQSSATCSSPTFARAICASSFRPCA